MVEDNPGASNWDVTIESNEDKVQFISVAEFIAVRKVSFFRMSCREQPLLQPLCVAHTNAKCRTEDASFMPPAMMRRVEKIIGQFAKIDECLIRIWQLSHGAKLRQNVIAAAHPSRSTPTFARSIGEIFGGSRRG
jgi:hypothetical protein